MWISSCHTGCCISLLVQYVGMDSFSYYTRGDDDGDGDGGGGDDDMLITMVKIIITITAVSSLMHNSVRYN